MSKFDYTGLVDDDGFDSMFIANSARYNVRDVLELFNREYSDRDDFREPTEDDVEKRYCIHRIGASLEWPNGHYVLTDDGERGSFPVWVIDFRWLRQR